MAGKLAEYSLNAVFKKAIKWGYYNEGGLNFEQICDDRDQKLFEKVLNNKHHTLYRLLPPDKTHTHDVRPRLHNRSLPNKENNLFSKNFIVRLLYKDCF